MAHRGSGRVRPVTKLKITGPSVDGETRIGPNPVPLWRRNVLPYQWVQIPNTDLTRAQKNSWFEHKLTHEPLELATVDTPGFPSPNTTAALNWSTLDYVGAAFAAYCGASIDTRDSTVYGLAGGGHNDYYGNFAWKIRFSQDAPLMVEAAPTSPGTAVDAGTGSGPYGLNQRLWLDGRPSSSHTGWCNQFIEARDRAMRFGSTSIGGSGGANFGNIVSLHKTGTDYEADGLFPDSPIPIRVDDSICKHPVTEDVYVWTRNATLGHTTRKTLMRWNQALNTWTILTNDLPNASVHVAAIDDRRNRMLVVGGTLYSGHPPLMPPTLVSLDDFTATTVTLTGTVPSSPSWSGSAARQMGMVFEKHPTTSTRDRFLVRQAESGSAVHSINAVTFEVTPLTTTGGSSIPTPHFSIGIYNRFLPCPQYGGILYGPKANGNWWFLRTSEDQTGQEIRIAGDGDIDLTQVVADADGRLHTPFEGVEINRRVLNLADTLFFDTHHLSSRYERYQRMVVLEGSSASLRFKRFNIAAGGTVLSIAAGQYQLLIDGVVFTTITQAAGLTTGTFTVNLNLIADGWHIFEVKEVANPSRSTAPWAMCVNKSGGVVTPSATIPVVAGSYDLTHGSDMVHAFLPNTFAPTPMPLVARTATHFSTAEPRTNLFRESIVVHRSDTNINRPSITADGVVGTFNYQNYTWQDVIRKYPALHLMDGERGIGSLMSPTHIMLDRHGGAYCADSWRVVRVSQTGKVTTRAGYRSSSPPRHYTEQRNGDGLELVGDWSAIPVERRGFHETWGLAFDRDSLASDPDGVPQFNSVNGQMELPHLNDVRLFVTDTQNNRIILLTFAKDDFNAEPVVTEFKTGMSDPWDIVWEDGKLYVSERQANRIVELDATTGEEIRTVVEGASIVTIGADRLVIRIGATTADQIAHMSTLRAEPVVLPDGLYFQDGWLYYGSVAQGEVRRVHLVTGEIQVICRPTLVINNANESAFIKFAVSDGTFGPRGTVFTTTWGNSGTFGFPEAWLPGTFNGTNATKWSYFLFSRGVERGKGNAGGWDAAGYPSSVGVGNGRMYCGSSEEGLYQFTKALPEDPTPNAAQLVSGRDKYKRRGYRIVYGDQGFGYQGLDLPFGEDDDIDAYLAWNGHTP